MLRLIRRFPRLLGFALEKATGRLLVGRAAVEVNGVSVHLVSFSPPDREAVLSRLESALQLFQGLAPHRFTRFVRDCGRIFVAHQATTNYWPMTNIVAIDASTLIDQPSFFTASSLVHEGVHARYTHCGILAWPDRMERIERRCIAEQLKFLEAAADQFPEATVWARRLRDAASEPWWHTKHRIRMMKRAIHRATQAPN